MPKLPTNLVKPPVFDNPLRRTTSGPAAIEPAAASAELSPVAPASTEPPGGVVIAIATGTRTEDARANGRIEDTRSAEQHELAPISHRITLRIEDQIRRALEAECYRRRVAGEKTNVAEIARGILRDWASDRA